MGCKNLKELLRDEALLIGDKDIRKIDPKWFEGVKDCYCKYVCSKRDYCDLRNKKDLNNSFS